MNLLLVSPCPYIGRKRPKVLKLPQLALNILASIKECDKIDFSMDYDID
jgi:hypothetical protein